MSRKKPEKLYLLHIVEPAARIESYISQGMEAFLRDRKTQDAVIKVLGNLTESAAQLDDDTKALYPDVPWAAIKAFRNVLVHDYLGDLDHEETWYIIQNDLPAFVACIRKILKEKYGLEL